MSIINDLIQAVAEDSLNRVDGVKKELDFVRSKEEILSKPSWRAILIVVIACAMLKLIIWPFLEN